jgi:uncharacterized membrane protein
MPITPAAQETRSAEYHTPSTVDQLTERNVSLIAQLDDAAKAKRSFTDRVVDQITGFCGRMAFVWVHVVWFSIWITLNLTHKVSFDPYPFNLLTLTVSLEAIFLSTFILISQNRQGRLSERRSHLDLQINLLSEQENTKMLTMLVAIQKHLGIHDKQPDTKILLESTEPQKMVEQIETLIEGEGKGKGI